MQIIYEFRVEIFFLFLNGKLFDFKNTPFRYFGFSVAMNAFMWDCG